MAKKSAVSALPTVPAEPTTVRVIAHVSGHEFTMETGPDLDRRLALDVNDPECVRIDDRRDMQCAWQEPVIEAAADAE